MESDPELAMLQMYGYDNSHSQGSVNDIFTKRSKLLLPDPQVNDDELEQVVKMGTETQNSRSSVIDSSRNNNFNTDDLLADYSTTPNKELDKNKLRTPTTVSRETNIMNEARNIIALNNVITPLKGGENTNLDVSKIDFSGVTPQIAKIQTPNTVLRLQNEVKIGETPNLQNSMRDKMNINTDIMTPSSRDLKNYTNSTHLTSLELKNLKIQKKFEKLQLRSMLDKLPAPKDDFEIVLPSKEKDVKVTDRIEEKDILEEPSILTIVDSSEIDLKNKEKLDLEKAQYISTLTTLVKENLPHPLSIKLNKNIVSKVDKLIEQEMILMMKKMLTKDLELINESSLKVVGISQKKFKNKIIDMNLNKTKLLESEIDIKSLEIANKLVNIEYDNIRNNNVDYKDFENQIDILNGEIYLSKCELLKNKKLQLLKDEFNYLKNAMIKYSNKVTKNQTKLQILVGGYQVFVF